MNHGRARGSRRKVVATFAAVVLSSCSISESHSIGWSINWPFGRRGNAESPHTEHYESYENGAGADQPPGCIGEENQSGKVHW